MSRGRSYSEIFLTSRSRTPSLIDVNSANEKTFAQLPDIIQEAAVSTEFPSPKLQIHRVQNAPSIYSEIMTEPMFYVIASVDSGIDMPDLTVVDEKFLEKYGSDLTANFSDIRTHGSRAFFQQYNGSDNMMYSLSTCATGHIWVKLSRLSSKEDSDGFSDLEIQIGTFALKARAITTREIAFRYRYSGKEEDTETSNITHFFAGVLARYLRLRIMGQQYESAMEKAVKQGENELWPFGMIDPVRFDNFTALVRKICANAPMPPISDVSLISRSMITRRWDCLRDNSVLRKRYFFPRRLVRCFRRPRFDSIDLFSGHFSTSELQKQLQSRPRESA